MVGRRGFGLRSAVVTVVALVGVALMPSAQAAQVTTEELPTPLVWRTQPTAVNEHGDVVGRTKIWVDPNGAFLWDDQGDIDLQAISGAQEIWSVLSPTGAVTGHTYDYPTATSMAYAYDRVHGYRGGGTMGGNRAEGIGFVGGQIVGRATDAKGTWHAFQWDGSGPLVDLGSLDGGPTQAFLVSTTGIVGGTSQTADGLTHIVQWVGLGAPQDLGVLTGFAGSASNLTFTAIADDGSVFGDFTVPDGTVELFQRRAVTGSVEVMATPPGVSLFYANARGQWTGWACTSPAGSPYCYTHSVVRWEWGGEVATLPTDPNLSAMPTDINDRGQILGFVRDGGGTHSFLWDPNCGLTDLPGPAFQEAWAMSNNGFVAGWRSPPGEPGYQAFRMRVELEPCAPPEIQAAADAQVRVSWQTPDGRDAPVNGYRVYRDGAAVADVDASVTSWQDDPALTGTHTYAVSATNAFGESDQSAPAVVAIAAPVDQPVDDNVDPGTTAPAAGAVTATPAFTG